LISEGEKPLDAKEPMYWLNEFAIEVLILYLIMFIAFFSFHTVMSKLLNIEDNFFSHSHINERHKKIDWTIKTTFFIVLLLLFFCSGHTGEKGWFYGICLLGFTFPITLETVRAFMEWKYEENRKYILTVSRLAFGVIFLCLMVATDFFGLL
jgi:VanZ family protein